MIADKSLENPTIDFTVNLRFSYELTGKAMHANLRAWQLGKQCSRSWRTRASVPSYSSSSSSSSCLLSRVHRRCMNTDIPRDAPLQTPEDWTEFQIEHADEKMFNEHYSQYGSAQSRENTWQPHHSLHRPPSPGDLTLSALLAAGAHLGHSTSLLNPNFLPYAYGTRAGITVIDLDRTMPMLRRAAKLTRAIATEGGSIVFIGTRPDLRPVVKKASERMGHMHSYYVGEKWLPGTLTNRLHHFDKETVVKNKVIPDLMIILNPLANMAAIREAAIEHVPTIGVIDSNVDPRIVMYAIPANDESTRTAELIAGVLSIAGREGIEIRIEKQQRAERRRAQRDRIPSDQARRIRNIKAQIAAQDEIYGL